MLKLSNFGFDCRNNVNNLKFEPLINEIEELTYIRKYHNLFDEKIKSFVSSSILEQNINQEFDQSINSIKNDDPFRNVRITELKNKKQEEMDALECLKKKEKKTRKRLVKDDFEDRKTSLLSDRKIKTMIDFEGCNSNSIKDQLILK